VTTRELSAKLKAAQCAIGIQRTLAKCDADAPADPDPGAYQLS